MTDEERERVQVELDTRYQELFPERFEVRLSLSAWDPELVADQLRQVAEDVERGRLDIPGRCCGFGWGGVRSQLNATRKPRAAASPEPAVSDRGEGE